MGIQSLLAPTINTSMDEEEYAGLFKGSEIKVGNNCYYGYSKEGEKEISNFMMIPLYLIRDGA